jgi:hypothetical protein
MKVKISTSQLDEDSLMVCIEDDNFGIKSLFGIDYLLRTEGEFWIYDAKKEWVLVHDSKDCKIEKLK